MARGHHRPGAHRRRPHGGGEAVAPERAVPDLGQQRLPDAVDAVGAHRVHVAAVEAEGDAAPDVVRGDDRAERAGEQRQADDEVRADR